MEGGRIKIFQIIHYLRVDHLSAIQYIFEDLNKVPSWMIKWILNRTIPYLKGVII